MAIYNIPNITGKHQHALNQQHAMNQQNLIMGAASQLGGTGGMAGGGGSTWHPGQIMPTMIPNQIPSQTITPPQKTFRSVFLKKMHLIADGENKSGLPEGVLYWKNSPEALIEHLGKVCPMHRGRPKYFALTLLQSIPSPMKATSMTATHIYSRGMFKGMFLMHPPIPTRRRRSYQATLATIGLLDHWAQKWPSFKPHLDAYLTAKAKKTIISNEVDLTLGHVPRSIEQALADIAKVFEKQEQQRVKEIIAQESTKTLHKIKKFYQGLMPVRQQPPLSGNTASYIVGDGEDFPF